MMDWEPYRELAQDTVSAAGHALVKHRDEWREIAEESGRDIKLDGDTASEQMIYDLLSDTPFPILSEERGGKIPRDTTAPYWVVDPLDGSFNYRHELPCFAISIALCQGKKPRVGAIRVVPEAKTYSCSPATSALGNGQKIYVSSTSHVKDAVLATGFPVARSYHETALDGFLRGVQAFKKIRMLGSAATSLAWVACGRMDAYWEEDIFWWDVAAGVAMVESAGGKVIARQGSSAHQWHILALNGKLQPDAIEALLISEESA